MGNTFISPLLPMSRSFSPIFFHNHAEICRNIVQMRFPFCRDKLTQIPKDHLNTPGDYLNTPGDHLNTPGDYLNTPGDHLNTPGDYLNTPGNHLNILGDYLNAPSDYLNTPNVHQIFYKKK